MQSQHASIWAKHLPSAGHIRGLYILNETGKFRLKTYARICEAYFNVQFRITSNKLFHELCSYVRDAYAPFSLHVQYTGENTVAREKLH